MAFGQIEKVYCKECNGHLKLCEIDAMKGYKVMKCERCDLLYYYKKDIVGKWHLQKAALAVLYREDMLEDLVKSGEFLKLDMNWALATSALQLQEVAVTLVAKRKGIALEKANVEKVLNKKIKDELSFSDRYDAFTEQAKDKFKIEMPVLATHLRKMRTKVLHEGYNPKKEETEAIVKFTIGLLQRLSGLKD